MKKSFIALSVVASLALADGSYTLGKVSVASSIEDVNVIEQTITSQTIEQNNERTVAESLDNVSGISMSKMGARGETTLSIRGFDAKRIGVFIDGIPVYVPYDGNFDYDRFLTNDIAQIDISKGYSSVAYGANTMGGVINIISKKPTKELEGNIKGEIILDSDAQMSRHVESINVGSRVGSFYAQLSGSYNKRDHFRMSDDYRPTLGSVQPKGDRLRSESTDKKISLKAGFIADDASEIAITYANQQGVKEQPTSVDSTRSSVRYWDWPYWDKETFSISGQKNFGNSYIKALAYYDTIKNSIFSYDNIEHSSMNFGKSWKSRYDDYSYGARLEYGLQTDNNFLKLALNYKKDVHRAYDIDKITGSETLDEDYEDNTISLGVEDEYSVTKSLKILAGLSYDRRESDKLYDTNSAYTNMMRLTTQDAFTPQVALVYALDKSSKLRASAAQKTYLPSMKDRYSRRMGTSVPNVDLDKEIANHFELSYNYTTKNITAGANLYYSRINDAIQSVKYAQDPTKEQNQNVGDFEHKGLELEATYMNDSTRVGANYAFVDVKNKNDSDVKRTGVPENQFFAYVEQKIGAGFSIYANMKFRDNEYQQIANRDYVKMSSITTFDAKVIYNYAKTIQAEIGIKNLTDELIEYDPGFVEAGREYFAALNYKF